MPAPALAGINVRSLGTPVVAHLRNQFLKPSEISRGLSPLPPQQRPPAGPATRPGPLQRGKPPEAGVESSSSRATWHRHALPAFLAARPSNGTRQLSPRRPPRCESACAFCEPGAKPRAGIVLALPQSRHAQASRKRSRWPTTSPQGAPSSGREPAPPPVTTSAHRITLGRATPAGRVPPRTRGSGWENGAQSVESPV